MSDPVRAAMTAALSISRAGDVWSRDAREQMHMVGTRLLPWWARRWARPWWEHPIISVRFRPHPTGRQHTMYRNGGTLTVLWPSIRGGRYLERSIDVPAGQHYSAWLAGQDT